MATENDFLSEQIDALSGLADSGDDLVLEGYLGRMVQQGKITGRTGQQLQKAVQKTVQNKLLNTTITRDQRFIMGKASELQTAVRKDIASGNSQFEELDVYIRREISGANQATLMRSSDVQRIGIQNLQSNVLPMGTAASISKIKLSYGFANQAVSNPALVKYTNAMDAETAGTAPLAIPAELLNGEYELKINNTTKLKVPVKRFFRDSFSVGTAIEGVNDVLELKTPILVQGGEKIEAYINLVDGSSLPVPAPNDRHFVEMRLMGSIISPR